MQAADYRLVRSHITAGIMMGIKQSVFPKTVDDYFSYWLYGQRKSTKQILINVPGSIPCLVCSKENSQYQDICLLTIDLNSFLQYLPLFNSEQLTTLYSLLDGDRQFYEYAIRQQYKDYKQMLIQQLEINRTRQYHLV
ncbi:unnamed protein product [Rotaria socialis]|uniref:Uncharacterized protein n=1 Tax=Rotaria socialis TaxID=392032 RepID=A0A819AV75_9BILA|nr:unnamed protein product [Rotaria socialis]CAF3265987.1 unnamed protein product [Rotaria socialis]CAF3399091.1 unnamed protein product [Rotaria socialis]CAF3779154.1 unnamed protein product [Rotaria socialis]CAF3782911.1 unnamed protein product [Rotaria socialis]